MSHPSRILVVERADADAGAVSAVLSDYGIDNQSKDLSDLVDADLASGQHTGLFSSYGALLVNAAALNSSYNRSGLITALKKLSILTQHLPALLLDNDPESEAVALGRSSWDDIVITPTNPVHIVSRINSLLRFYTKHRELHRRIKTASCYGIDTPSELSQPINTDNINIMVFGIGQHLALIEQALPQGMTMIGAYTWRTALDYLERIKFDTVIIESGGDPETIAEVVRQLRADIRYFALPIIALGRHDDADWCNSMLQTGVTEILDPSESINSFHERLKRLTHENRFRDRLNLLYQDTQRLISNDALTGLYTRGFMLQHLAQLQDDAAGVADRFSLIWFKLRDLTKLNHRHNYATGDRIIRQFGHMLGHIVRSEDLAARSHGGEFVLLLPDTPASAAMPVLKRVIGIAHTTEFSVPEIFYPIRMELSAGVTSNLAEDTPEQMIARAIGDAA